MSMFKGPLFGPKELQAKKTAAKEQDKKKRTAVVASAIGSSGTGAPVKTPGGVKKKTTEKSRS